MKEERGFVPAARGRAHFKRKENTKMSIFKPAERKQVKLRLAFTGPSGSGKTYSALLVASGIGKKIAVVDTENKSASLYADKFKFDTLEIEPPYTTDKYLKAIEAAEQAGYDVLVIDSISHQWAGEGGMLDKKSALDARGGNSFTNWASMTKEHEVFKSRLLNTKVHLIVTMRSKTEYTLETNEKGRSVPRKVGMAPIQRENSEYEFDVVFDMAQDHNASVSKTRIEQFDGKIFKPTKKIGQELHTWLMEGKAPAPMEPESLKAEPAKEDKPRTWAELKKVDADIKATVGLTQMERMIQAFVNLGLTEKEVLAYIKSLPFSDEKGIVDHMAKVYLEVRKDKELLNKKFKGGK